MSPAPYKTYGWDGDHWVAAEPHDLLTLSNKELKSRTAASRSEIIKGIRAQRHLTSKQRWRLAAWLADMENRRANRLLKNQKRRR